MQVIAAGTESPGQPPCPVAPPTGNQRKNLFRYRWLPVLIFIYLLASCGGGGGAGTSPSGQSSSSAVAAIQIDTTKIVRTIPRAIYGVNIEWTHNADGIVPAATATTNNSWFFSPPQTSSPLFYSSAYAALQSFGVSTIRFPGGIYADFYNWRNGVNDGLNDQASLNAGNLPAGMGYRAAAISNGVDGNSPNTIGTDDIVALSENIGAVPPLFQIALRSPYRVGPTDATAQTGDIVNLAADWVRYCNTPGDARRTANEPLGGVYPSTAYAYGVNYWEIGNEPYYSANTSNPSVSWPAYTGADYAALLQQVAQAMRNVDPAIKIIAASTFDDGMGEGNWNVAGSWNSSLITTTLGDAVAAGQTPPFDMVAVHDSYAPVFVKNPTNNPDGQNLTPDDIFQAMWAFPLQMSTNQKNLENLLAAAEGLPVGSVPKTGIAVTEWGPLFAQGSVGLSTAWYDYPKTMGSAIFVASALEAFIRDPGVVMADYFDFTSIGPMGLMSDAAAASVVLSGTSASAIDPIKPSGYVFKLFHDHFGPQLVATTLPASNPTYNVRGAESNALGRDAREFVAAMAQNTGIPKLDVVSSLSADGDTLYVMVVNKSLKSDSPISTTISLTGFQPDGQGCVSTLTSGSLIDSNGNDIDYAASGLPDPLPGGYPPMTNTQPITIASSLINSASSSFTYSFVPGSVTAITLTRSGTTVPVCK